MTQIEPDPTHSSDPVEEVEWKVTIPVDGAVAVHTDPLRDQLGATVEAAMSFTDQDEALEFWHEHGGVLTKVTSQHWVLAGDREQRASGG